MTKVERRNQPHIKIPWIHAEIDKKLNQIVRVVKNEGREKHLRRQIKRLRKIVRVSHG